MAGKGKGGLFDKFSSKSSSKDTSKTTDSSFYDKFIVYLKSPIWVLPVMSFVEQRSLVFDKDEGDEKLFKQIYNEYRNMVDMLIQCFCEDVGIKPSEVSSYLKKDNNQMTTKLEQSIFEPVIAAHDYNVFKHMMIRKNIELQLQALEMIQVIYGLIPSVLLPGGPEDMGPLHRGEDEQERLILIEVIRQSKEDYEREKLRNSRAQEELEKAIRDSLSDKERLERERQTELNLTEKAMGLNLNVDEENDADDEVEGVITGATKTRRQSSTTTKASRDLPTLKSRSMSTTEGPAYHASVATAKPTKEEERLKRAQIQLLPNSDKISPEELKLRQEYLRKQRDKLLAMKQDAREKAFAQADDNRQNRPKTSKAARNIMRGRGAGEGEIDAEMLAARKALIAKLKNEVIHK